MAPRFPTQNVCFHCDSPLPKSRIKACLACSRRHLRITRFVYRARHSGATGTYTVRNFLAQSDAQKHRCEYCRAVARLVPRLRPHASVLSPDTVSLWCLPCIRKDAWSPEQRAIKLREKRHPGHTLVRLTGWARGSEPGTGRWVGALWCETCQVALNPLALCNRATRAGKGRPCRMVRGKRGCPIHDTLRAQLGADQEKKAGRTLWLDAPLKA